jgi:hypothetical protein
MTIRSAIRIEDAQGAIRISQRERPKEGGVHQAEDRRVPADAQGQRQYNHSGERRRLPE